MDDFVIGVYMRELENQAEAATLAAQDLNAAMVTADRFQRAPRAFAAAQAPLAAACMISKMLWPTPAALNIDGTPLNDEQQARRERTLARGKVPRAALGIRTIPVLESRKVRNAMEHFDERLDQFFEAGNRMVLDRNLGARASLVVIEGEPPPPHLRLLDPAAGSVSVLDDKVSIQELHDAAVDVGQRANKWAEESHERQRAEAFERFTAAQKLMEPKPG